LLLTALEGIIRPEGPIRRSIELVRGEMKPDSIVRMYSMTKAVTGVAAMMLYEEGRFSLNDSVSMYLPEFAKMRVAHESTDASGKRTYYTVPADQPMSQAFLNLSHRVRSAIESC
jgi:Beta-lactamase